MITDLPTHDDFKELGTECLVKSIEMLYSISKILQGINNELNDEEAPIEWDKFWAYHHVDKRASLILAYQGVEYLMKSCVAKESPLLLIQNNRNEWPTLPSSRNKKFEELQTVSGEQLLYI